MSKDMGREDKLAELVERYADLLLTKAQDEPLDFRRVFKKCVNEVLKLYHKQLLTQKPQIQEGVKEERDEET